MRKESIYLGLALCLAICGLVLFAQGKKNQEEMNRQALLKAQQAIETRQVGLITVIEDKRDNLLHVAFPPERIVGTWQMPATLEPVGLEGLATGRFFIHTQGEKGVEGCELWHLTQKLQLQGVQWPGRCRPHPALGADFFWLDYTPNGSDHRLALPLSLNPDDLGRYNFAWGQKMDEEDLPPLEEDEAGTPQEGSDEESTSDEALPQAPKSPFYQRFQSQNDALMEEVQQVCPTHWGDDPKCHSAVRALVFLRTAQGGPKEAQALVQRMKTYAPKAGKAVEDALPDILEEIMAIRTHPK